MDIKVVDVKKVKPYENNPRNNDDAVEAVANSIREFGWQQPIVVDKDNVIIAGHTRYKAALYLGMKKVPIKVADELTEEQVAAYRLADNKVSELAEWDDDLLNIELADILDINMEQFGFEFFDPEEEHFENKVDIQHRVRNVGGMNMDYPTFDGVGMYDIPELMPVTSLPEIKEWIPFNYVMSDSAPEGKGVHFFIDDYQFQRVWNNPAAYIEKLSRYAAVMTPDFSPYSDMPMAMQIFNHYRKHWVGRYWQESGITVIPTIRASADERSLDWYLDGEPDGGIVCVSAVWTQDDAARKYFVEREYAKMRDVLHPTKIFVYGGSFKDGELAGNIEKIPTYCRNHFDKDDE